MKRQDLLKQALKGSNDYYSLMRSVVFDILPKIPAPAQAELDKFEELPFFKASFHIIKTPINRYTKIDHLPNSVLVESVAWIHMVKISCRITMCRYCEFKLKEYFLDVSPTLYFHAWVCSDAHCQLCGAYEPMETYDE